MFCPNCGKESMDDRRFCSTCGTNLHLVKQAVNGNLQSQMSMGDIPENLLPGKKNKKLKAAGFIVMGLGLLYMVTMGITSKFVGNLNWEVGVLLKDLIPFGTLFFIIGGMIMAYGRIMYNSEKTPQFIVVNPQQLNQQPPAQNPPLQSSLNQDAIPVGENFNPPYYFSPPSVTEQTTSELKRSPESIRIRQ